MNVAILFQSTEEKLCQTNFSTEPIPCHFNHIAAV